MGSKGGEGQGKNEGRKVVTDMTTMLREDPELQLHSRLLLPLPPGTRVAVHSVSLYSAVTG